MGSSLPNRSWSHSRWPSNLPSPEKKEAVIVKFKSMKKKRKILIDRQNLFYNHKNISQLKFAGKLLISESMCHENHQLAYKCRKLKNAGKIHSAWFWNNVINVKLNERSQPAKMYRTIDSKKLGVDNLDEFISNTSFFNYFTFWHFCVIHKFSTFPIVSDYSFYQFYWH